MATLNISLPDPISDFAESQARKEGFGTVDEYVGSILREIQIRQEKRALEMLLREGLESGPGEPLTREAWDAIEREALDLAASHTSKE